ncbi:AMIN-like domain-containing (lipo)protein [Streptomyces exfoliatus]|uniref:AMIN-like domain-containing (lipo)protein n=1 Tax=Streptomyces exfoliatus TaxID=1905 RepID=UPI003C2D95FE
MRLTRSTSARIATSLAAAALLSALAVPAATAAPESAATASAAAFVCSDACLLGTRAATHPDRDRLVFDFTADGLPAVSSYVSPDGTYTGPMGKPEPLQIRGTSYLIVTLSGAHMYDDNGALTYPGPYLQQPNLPVLKGVEFLGEFEGRLTFGLTLNTSSRQATFNLTAPNRVVFDLYR